MKSRKAVSKLKEPTLRSLQSDVHDVLRTVSASVTKTEKRFDVMDQRFDRMDQKFDRMDQRFGEIEGRVKDIEGVMVTKEYLDDKLLDLRGDLVTLLRKEDRVVLLMVQILREKDIFSEADVERLTAHTPFVTRS